MDYRMSKSKVLILGVLFLSSCLKGQGQKTETDSSPKPAETTKPGRQVGSARVSPSSTDTAVVVAADDSDAAGSDVSFPPGSLAVDTNVRLEDGVTLATPATMAVLGVAADNHVAPASGSVAVLADGTTAESAAPFSLNLQLSEVATALALDDGLANLIVIYHAVVNGMPVFGTIPRAELTVENGKVTISTTRFGVYQAALVDVPSAVPSTPVPAGPVATRKEAARSPIAVVQLSASAFAPGAKIDVKGANFRPSVNVTVGGIQAHGVIVSSDKSLSFVVPAGVTAGSVDVSFEQDGARSSVQGFVNDGTVPLPTISDDPTKRLVSDADRALWTAAAGWGDHGTAGYLKASMPARVASLWLLSNNGMSTPVLKGYNLYWLCSVEPM
jgi:hypothetical protein